jgi:hypothetical protein
MDGAPERSPLEPVLAASVITLPFDYYAYLIHSDLFVFGILIIATKALFFVLYLRRPRLAWHVGFGLTATITALALLLIYRGGEAGEPRYPWRHFLELTIVVPLLVYQWRTREPYIRYLQL